MGLWVIGGQVQRRAGGLWCESAGQSLVWGVVGEAEVVIFIVDIRA